MSAAVAALPTPTVHAPFGAMSTRDLETELLGTAGHIAAAQCRFLQLLAEFDHRGGWAGPGVRSCAHWLSWRIGMSLRTAAEQLRVAHALQRLPKITEAFAEGRISYSKVRAITRITGADAPTASDDAASAAGTAQLGADRPTEATTSADETADADTTAGDTSTGVVDMTAGTDEAVAVPGAAPVPDPDAAEQVLLNLALSGTASHVETVVRAVRRRRSAPAATAARRGVSWHWAEDGSLVLRGRFAPAEGAALIAALDAHVPAREPIAHPVPDAPHDWRERAVEQAPGPTVDRRAAHRADAMLGLVTGPADPHTTGTRATDTDTLDTPNGGGDAGDDRAGGPAVTRGGVQFVVHFDVSSGAARINGGPEIPASTAERVACDARVQVLLDDRDGNRLYLGRSRRTATAAQITALTARDGTRCQFPGCTHTRRLHAHHVQHWLHGGRTDIHNLILLCNYHHGVIHDHGYRIHRLPHGWQIHRPDGSPVPTTAPPLSGQVEGLIEIAARDQLRITRDSLTPTWTGERLDPEPILDALLPRRPTTAA